MTLLCAELFHEFSGNPQHGWIPKLRRAPKFLIDDSHFDNLDDFDNDVDAAKETLHEAIVAGRKFKLPFPELLLEWRVPKLPIMGAAAEVSAAVVYAAERNDDAGGVDVVAYVLLRRPGQKRDEWHGVDNPLSWGGGVAKLLVMLDADRTVRERVLAANLKRNWNGSPRTKPYDHTVLRAPVEYVGAPAGAAPGTGTPRRMHLVRGFQWGRHTRPIEEQRWIKPHWRGDASVGVVRRDHYRVAGTGQ